MDWETVIGLEVHAQLTTCSKLFSGASTRYGANANTQANAIDCGLPGTLPVINQKAVDMAVKFGLAIEAQIAKESAFARKHYFYPDLPKNYQISQFELPIVRHGKITIKSPDGNDKIVGIERAHLEEDAGKSVHNISSGMTGIDLNRSGIPLIEIVSEPVLSSAEEAVSYLKKIRTIVRYLQICDGNMQEGSLRCDANVSVKPESQRYLGIRTEIKNLNSFRFIEQAINYEINRQIKLIESGGKVVQETLLYDTENQQTRPMRGKEEAHDYRYFPDPDLPPVYTTQERIDAIEKQLPELPDAKHKRFISEYKLSEYASRILISTREQADYFESVVNIAGRSSAELSANWIMVELSSFLNKYDYDIEQSPVDARMLGALIKRIADNTISNRIAKQIFEAMCNGEGSADEIIEKKKLRQITNINAIEDLVNATIAENPEQINLYRTSTIDKQKKLISFFVGQVMKRSKGKANPQQVSKLFKEKLK